MLSLMRLQPPGHFTLPVPQTLVGRSLCLIETFWTRARYLVPEGGYIMQQSVPMRKDLQGQDRARKAMPWRP
ncbi:hypothetical protein NDU88_005339 [Pleurodeles waltl]|uniref:Uncharacterized protein n=1 Tax=Pleurodeles waltl TaxID=8319 RepID=A0AAV7PK37_PLEWA|nr:hypothetical protein NDU88_005339 [Pleurodeles waltl]